MSDLAKIKTPDGTVYDLKDATARTTIGGVVDGTDAVENLMIELDTTAASGTDHDLYQAIVALGWDSDVIVTP